LGLPILRNIAVQFDDDARNLPQDRQGTREEPRGVHPSKNALLPEASMFLNQRQTGGNNATREFVFSLPVPYCGLNVMRGRLDDTRGRLCVARVRLGVTHSSLGAVRSVRLRTIDSATTIHGLRATPLLIGQWPTHHIRQAWNSNLALLLATGRGIADGPAGFGTVLGSIDCHLQNRGRPGTLRYFQPRIQACNRHGNREFGQILLLKMLHALGRNHNFSALL